MKTNLSQTTIKARRKIILFLALFFSLSQCSVSKSQDTIHLRNNGWIEAKVLEISSTEVKYKKAKNINGPDYVELKNDVEFIKYSNGIVETFKEEPREKSTKEVINNLNYRFYYYPSQQNSDFVITKLGDTIKCKIDRITNNVIYYRTLRHGMDPRGTLVVSELKKPTKQIPIKNNTVVANKIEKPKQMVKTKNTEDSVVSKTEATVSSESENKKEETNVDKTFIEKPWLLKESKIETHPIETKSVENPFLIDKIGIENKTIEVKNVDKPWLIPETKKVDGQTEEVKNVDKPWLIQETKTVPK